MSKEIEKEAQFAGSWYPADSTELTNFINQNLDEKINAFENWPKILIMPHAGYKFSGRVAAKIARYIDPASELIVIIGPSHRHRFNAVACTDATSFATPLGTLKVHQKSLKNILSLSEIMPEAFENEHSVEMILPLVKHRAPNTAILPLIAGQVDITTIKQILDKFQRAKNTQIIISTDLSHFETAEIAEKLDLATANAIETRSLKNWSTKNACGARPLLAALQIASEEGMRITRTSLTHSGNITGDMSRVVGYGGWVAHNFGKEGYSKQLKGRMLSISASAINGTIKTKKRVALNFTPLPDEIKGFGAAFVTLKKNGHLRGCIGSLVPHRPLSIDICERSMDAAFNDPRFLPLEARELLECHLSISILGPQKEILFENESDLVSQIEPGRDGLWLMAGKHRGTFLPSVWESIKSPQDFLDGVKRKAGLKPDFWSDNIKVFRYRAESFGAPIKNILQQ